MDFEIDKLPRVFAAEVAFEYVGAPTTRLGVGISKDSVILTKVFFGFEASVFMDDVRQNLTDRPKVGSLLNKQ